MGTNLYISIMLFILIMTYIIIDTSSILFALSNNKDVFEAVKLKDPSYEPLISLGILNELNGIGGSEKGKGKFANAALYMIKEHQPDIANSNATVDDWIVEEAEKRKCDVCTNDMELKKRLKEKGITVFTVSRSGELR